MVERNRLVPLIAGAALALLASCDRVGAPKAQFKAIDITGADYARELSLPDSRGQQRTLADFRGKAIVVFFGYTQCPDVCPTSMLEIAAARKQLGADAARVQGVFVTIDPERDTPELLSAYVDNFGADFVALRGDGEQTKTVAKHFKVFYAKVPGKTDGSYTMDHTAGGYVFDTQGRIRLFTRYGTGPDALAHDLKLLLAEPG